MKLSCEGCPNAKVTADYYTGQIKHFYTPKDQEKLGIIVDTLQMYFVTKMQELRDNQGEEVK
jgi:hypothetical protein